jgi:SPX domain protein involved in polyphosphate accumulation
LHRTGQEINKLSRFVNVQRVALRKLLKKYKKWTGNEELGTAFTREVLNAPDSFWSADFGPLLDHYTAVLQTIRVAYQGDTLGIPSNREVTPRGVKASPSPFSRTSSGVAFELQNAIKNESLVDFDLAFAASPVSPYGNSAVYWVHPDCLIELQVLLLQYMRLFAPQSVPKTPVTPLTPSGRTSPTPSSSRRSSTARPESSASADKDDNAGTLILDDPEHFAKRTSDDGHDVSLQSPKGPFGESFGFAKWASNGEAVVAIQDFASQSRLNGITTSKSAKIKRKQLKKFLDTSGPYPTRSPSNSSITEGLKKPTDAAVDEVRALIARSEHCKPCVGVFYKRTRFVGLQNTKTRGLWITLDRDVFMKDDCIDDVMDNDWYTKIKRNAFTFPHAVLQVRYEGAGAAFLIQTLDRSHLVSNPQHNA